jgi:8-oxo-dGTP pyrophosphatase MutT (NUDIX family)
MKEPDQVIPFDRLPERFAERVADPPANPVEPRPAATIVLLRDSPDGMQVLLMRRNRRAGFVPGAYVFPGGRVDGTDADASALARLDGLSASEAAERLALADSDPPAIAYYLAALREAFEETGILVGVRPDGSAPPTAAENAEVDSVREAVMDDRVTFAEAAARLDCRIAGDSVEYLAHWITPVPEPRRYDTRFFAAKVAVGSMAIVDPREMTDAVWATPTVALGRVDEGSMPMVFPTIRTLEQLERYRAADEALEALRRSPVRTILPTLVVTHGGIGMRVDYQD